MGYSSCDGCRRSSHDASKETFQIFVRWTGQCSRSGVSRAVRAGKVCARYEADWERTERCETCAALHSLAERCFLDHRLVRHDARLPKFVHESILPRKLRRIRELLRLVPHRTGVTEKATSRVPPPSRASRPPPPQGEGTTGTPGSPPASEV